MVMGRALRLVGAGLTIGLGASVLAGRFMDAVLFGVPAIDAGVFAVVTAVMAAAGLFAAWVPASRATAVDPVGAMAAE
jgi:ABC-type antimicrobial peptide transport system permease subunit